MNARSNSLKNKKNSLRKKRGCLFMLSIILTVIVLALSILLFIRYDAWFSNIPEDPYVTPKRIERITLTPGEDFLKERVISWRYDSIEHKSYVEYYKLDSTKLDFESILVPANSKYIKTRAGHAYYYHVGLSELEAGNDYNYRVISDNDTSSWRTFNMPALNDTLRFLYMGDIQDPRGEESDSLFNILQKKLLKFDFIAFAGDQIERPMDKYWNLWYNSLSEWSGVVPLVNVAGNHEYIKGLNKNIDERWTAQHNYPQNGPEDFKGLTYYVDFPLMRIIIIDSNVIQWPNAVLQHRNWLKKSLEGATQPWKVVMFHHGVHSVRAGRSNLMMRYLFLPVLEDCGADLVLQGHDHAYSRITTKAEGDTIPPVYVISTASPKFYRNGFDPIHDRIGSGIALYQSVEVTKENLSFKSYLFDGTLYDDLTIHRNTDGQKQVIDKAHTIKEIFNFDGFGKGQKGEDKRRQYLEDVKKREEYMQSKLK